MREKIVSESFWKAQMSLAETADFLIAFYLCMILLMPVFQNDIIPLFLLCLRLCSASEHRAVFLTLLCMLLLALDSKPDKPRERFLWTSCRMYIFDAQRVPSISDRSLRNARTYAADKVLVFSEPFIFLMF